MSGKNPLFVNSLAKGLGILEAFTPDTPSLSLSELTMLSGLHKAAVQRYTHTLCAMGYLQRGPHKRFSLAPRVLALGYACLQGSSLINLLLPFIKELADQVDCSVNLSVLDDTKALVLHRQELKRSFFSYDIHAGTRLPIHCTSMGKVFLASLPDEELKARLSRLDYERMTRHTITSPEELLAQVKKVRISGVGEADREASLDLHSMAVPLINREKQIQACLSISNPVGREGGPGPDEARKILIDHGRKISAILGYSGKYPFIPVASAA
jgi:IclR family pca regulon transcriptional regulator